MNSMTNRLTLITALVAASATLVLSGCATTGADGTEVTRFHMGQAIAAQDVNLQPAEQADASSLQYQNYAAIIEAGLATAGFTSVPGDEAGMIAEINIVRGLRAKAPKRSGFSVGVGAGRYGGSGGISGGASIPVGGSSGGEVYVMQLDVSLIDRTSNAVVWEGTAIRESDVAPGTPVATMQLLSDALFADFPGPSGKTVIVPTPASAAE